MSEFNRALSNFTNEVASGGSIRHLADLGYTVKEIKDNLTYPTPIDRIRETVWKHFIDIGVIKIANDKPGDEAESYTYEKEQDKYGNVSFRRVKKSKRYNADEYIPCDFGKRIYKDKDAFVKSLEVLSDRDREYILGLPWSLETVYHIADERMKRISEKLKVKEAED